MKPENLLDSASTNVSCYNAYSHELDSANAYELTFCCKLPFYLIDLIPRQQNIVVKEYLVNKTTIRTARSHVSAFIKPQILLLRIPFSFF